LAFGSIFAEVWNHTAAVGSAVSGFRTVFNELFMGFVKAIVAMPMYHALTLMWSAVLLLVVQIILRKKQEYMNVRYDLIVHWKILFIFSFYKVYTIKTVKTFFTDMFSITTYKA
jgi:hypothetical protein